jgi:Tfp pilus assembly protein PilO
MSVFNKIDNYFYSRQKKEFVYMVILAVFLIGFVIYYFLYPLAAEYKTKQEKKYSSLSTQYQVAKTSIRVLEARISLLNKKIKEKQSKVATLKKQKMFYTELANLLDFAEFDQYKWANLIRETVTDAKNKGMEVTKVENQIYDINTTKKADDKKLVKMPEIVKRMDIGIELEGKYNNFIYYLYNYENRKELIRVREMNITSPSTFYVKFSIYGYDQ